jgi:plasmid stabilization system protein ParE
MKRRIVWAPEALRDLSEQLSFIAAEDTRAAHLVVKRIDAAAKLLAGRPVGRPGRVAGTYEKQVLRTKYIIAYELPDDRLLHILRVIHTTRHWPQGGWPEDQIQD